MNVYLSGIEIGLIATAVMTAFLFSVHIMRIADVDMLTAIGSIFIRRDLKKAFILGLFLHFITGIVFAFIYLAIASYFGFHNWFDYLFFGSIIGFAHGIVVSIIVVILVAEHHPLERFRKSGFSVVASHAVAHVIYGFALGFATAVIQPPLETLSFFGLGIL